MVEQNKKHNKRHDKTEETIKMRKTLKNTASNLSTVRRYITKTYDMIPFDIHCIKIPQNIRAI